MGAIAVGVAAIRGDAVIAAISGTDVVVICDGGGIIVCDADGFGMAFPLFALHCVR